MTLTVTTLRKLGKLAGVSQITVSRALRNDPHVSPETREKILDLAEKHGYRLNSYVISPCRSVFMKFFKLVEFTGYLVHPFLMRIRFILVPKAGCVIPLSRFCFWDASCQYGCSQSCI